MTPSYNSRKKNKVYLSKSVCFGKHGQADACAHAVALHKATIEKRDPLRKHVPQVVDG